MSLNHCTNKYILIVAFVLVSFASPAQTNTQEFTLIEKQNFHNPKFDKRKVQFMKTRSKNVLLRYNPVSLTFGGLMYFYQKTISPQLASNCPYEISCSAFSKLCIQEFGLIKGIALTADRLTRCTQFTVIDITPLHYNSKNQLVDPISNYKRIKHKH
jgi:uncharacterized protein